MNKYTSNDVEFLLLLGVHWVLSHMQEAHACTSCVLESQKQIQVLGELAIALMYPTPEEIDLRMKLPCVCGPRNPRLCFTYSSVRPRTNRLVKAIVQRAAHNRRFLG
jgi:hypothetical protein